MATLRRSSAKLRSLGSGHADLILAISQWKELRSATKSLMAAQESTSNDLLKWSSKEVLMSNLLQPSWSKWVKFYHFWPKNDDDKWSRKNIFEVPPCDHHVIFITEFVLLIKIQHGELMKEFQKYFS